ncbi:MAG: Pseudopilin GspJ [candidate division BRC1 bacterium ADurb.BinA364]|nr:MAG: Pseudopilin GspJ [candidate division BRC1 bacterium ADurb.BinA364]
MTLIEIVVGVAITALLMSAAYSVYSAATSGWYKSRRRIDMHQRARVSLDLITRCLRAADASSAETSRLFEGVDQLVEPETVREGEPAELDLDTLRFRTNAPIRALGSEAAPDLTEVEFYIQRQENAETGEVSSILYMRADPSLGGDSAAGGWVIELAEDIQSLNFGYFNGTEWVESWTSSDGVPKAVEAGIVVLDAKGAENPMRFSRIAPVMAWRPADTGRTIAADEAYSFEESRT